MSDQFGKDRNQELIDKIYDLMDEGPEEIIEYLEDYIRQQIGRELLDGVFMLGRQPVIGKYKVIEICKLGEGSE